MPTTYTEQTFPSTYKDDYDKSKNYHRILFNSGKALQARELTQLQTVIQKEITQLTGNLFEEGAAITPGSFRCDNKLEFIKIASGTPFPSDPTTLEGVEFSSSDNTIKFTVVSALAAENGDPDTLYVEYTQDSNGSETGTRVPAGDTLTSTGGDFTLNVQQINTTTNPAVGLGSSIQVDEGHFFIQGRIVYCPPQRLVFRKYSNNASSRFGFTITQDIVTSDDDETLFDNQGATPNLTSPGADRYRIRLVLSDARVVTKDKIFIPIIEVSGGQIVSSVTASSGFKSIREEMATRTHETAGDYIKRYFRASFAPNSTSNFKLKVTPGTAYVRGFRVNKDAETTIIVDKPQETLSRNNDSITIDYGNYFLYSNGKGTMPDFTTCEELNLHSGANGTGSVIGITRVRALNEAGGISGQKKIHVFATTITSAGSSIRDIQSICSKTSPTANYLNVYREPGTGVTKMYRTDKRPLLFDAPIRRPKIFSDISLTVAKRISQTQADAQGEVSVTSSASGDLANAGNWIVSSADSDVVADTTVSFGSTTSTIGGLVDGTSYDVLYYEKINNASQKAKELRPHTVTRTLDSDGDGTRFINLGKTDIYEITRCTVDDSDGKNVLGAFGIDNGQRDTHYGLGKLVYKGSGLDSDEQPVYVKMKYFHHTGDGHFFGVNSYDGQVTYGSIPVHRTNGKVVSLRDVLDFRPSVNTSDETFTGGDTHIFGLPQENTLVNADAEYYMPRLDKLVLSKGGELRYIQGVSSMMPKYPSTPVDCIDLYKIEMGANTLHTKDLKTTIIPRRGYTMEDIGKLDKRLDKLEEATTLSLLELNATNERLFDSSGNERLHTGFFVDNFKNQKFADTKNLEHRASHDPTKGLVRPPYTCKTIPLIFDSAHSISTGVTQKGDNVMLAHTEKQYLAQNMASQTINVNPFHVEKTYGDLVLSPSKDTWKNFEQDAPTIIDGGTEFDASQALLWNEQEYAWGGTDVNDLQVGMTTDPLVSQTSNTTLLGESTRQTGQEVSIDYGEWVEEGSNSSTTTLSSSTEVLGVENNQVTGDIVSQTESTQTAYVGKRITKPISPKFSAPLELNVKDEVIITFSSTYKKVFRCSAHNGRIKVYKLESGDADTPSNWTEFGTSKIRFDAGDKLMIKGVGTGSAHVYFYPKKDKWKNGPRYDVTVGRQNTTSTTTTNQYETTTNTRTTSTQDVSVNETVTNTTYGRTNTVSTENTYETTQEYNTATETTSTVNRIASESVLSEVVDNRELQIIHIPWMRSRKVSIRATNLRPNTRYFPFFNNTDVSRFCKTKTFYKSSTVSDPNYTIAESGANMVAEVDLPPATEHSEGSTNLVSDSNGVLEAEFEIPNLVSPPMRFPTGTAIFSLFDISKPDVSKSLSYCAQFYTASGVIESLSGEYTITNTRVLEIVGGQTTTVNNDRYTTQTVSTDTVVTTETQQDVKTETTQTQVYGPVETTTEVTGTGTRLVDTNTTYDYAQASGTQTIQGTASYSTGTPYLLPYNEAANTGLDLIQSQGQVFKDEDPTAQSFEVLDPNGIFLTRLRLYFAEKPESFDDQYGVSIAITEAPSGYPDRTRRVPGSLVQLTPAQVTKVPEANISSMVANGTDFVFDEPIFLQGNGANYAVIVRSKSMKYKMYISQVEDFVLGSTETRVTKQPTLGSLFVSQNTDVWEPRGQQDLAYVMYRADFETQGNAFLHNRNVRPTTLVKNPIMTHQGSDEITIYTTGHGLRKGDRTRIFGLDASTTYNGILGSDIMSNSSPFYRVVTSVDANSIKIQVGSAATVSGRTGTGKVRLLQHIPYDVVRPDFDILQPEATNYTLSSKMTSNSSFADSDAGRYLVDNSFQILRNKTNTTLEVPHAVFNQFEEVSETTLIANDQHSLTAQVTMTTTDKRVSPVLDLEATDMKLTGNIIDNTDPNVCNTYLDGEVTNKHMYIAEEHSHEGTAPAKHVTIPISLAETAVGLRVLMSVNRPPQTGIQLYWKTCSKDDNINDVAWESADTVNETPADNNKNAFREYSYLIGGQGGYIDPFQKFQLKVVFNSLNNAKVPVIKDLRCIALAD
ncbi:MAG: hypothetical protein CMA07_07130 [Euryarchaeota archaeon]|nr:hypothetical protein [Euryarchaeota archaeon]|tara:strand:+ start:24472 stop:30648 length:6177 start_codon:yes stop_codon:yes gene_type:complete